MFKNPFLESNLSCYFDWRVLIIYEYFEKYIVGLLNSLLSLVDNHGAGKNIFYFEVKAFEELKSVL